MLLGPGLQPGVLLIVTGEAFTPGTGEDAAAGVRTAAGEGVPARRAVLADVSAPALYGSRVAREHPA
ncbi:hypothetical protein [Streptomyces avidinii]|uniref:Uncharacterized protein n=1 Tax=Streptomyces avidinii TaxID=1895 RepID=A0ABS4KZL1_STRAV|nr:hypothetical protein [Streptomyces avidinii]MBP2035474.1 hypothetical protein [Streptomyces avidinii]